MDKQVAKDERQLENVSVKARPMNIQGKYQDICSNEWNDAKSLLDSKRIQAGEQQKMTFLVDIFLVSEILFFQNKLIVSLVDFFITYGLYTVCVIMVM